MDYYVTGMVLPEQGNGSGKHGLFFPSARDACKAFHEKYFLAMKGLKCLFFSGKNTDRHRKLLVQGPIQCCTHQFSLHSHQNSHGKVNNQLYWDFLLPTS